MLHDLLRQLFSAYMELGDLPGVLEIVKAAPEDVQNRFKEAISDTFTYFGPEWKGTDEPGILSVSKQKTDPGEPVVWVAVHEPVKSNGPSIARRGGTEIEARRNVVHKAAELKAGRDSA